MSHAAWSRTVSASTLTACGLSQRCADWLTDAGWRDYAAGVRAYSMDLRERIMAAVDEGMSQSQAAERFGVSLRTVERYLARRRAPGSLAATEQRHGREPKQRRQLQAWLPARLEAAADATLAEHAAAFLAPGGQAVSLSASARET